MNTFNVIIAIIATVSLFIFGMQGFSKELQKAGADKLKAWISTVTENRISGFLLGAVLTALIQSSSVVTSITVAMVDAGVITFFNSLSVLVGANLGSTFTAWLVAFKVDNLGSYLLVLGTLISIVPFRINLAGKAIFYLGLILFSLEQINLTLEPLSSRVEIAEWLSKADVILIGVLAGIVVTAVLQSSSVTTGLVIVLAGQNLLGLGGAIAIVIGSNLGTTATGILASISLSKTAKDAALANFTFNFVGLLLFLPFIQWFTLLITQLDLNVTYQIASAHLLFNFVVSIVALPLLKPMSKWVLKMSPY